MESFLYICKKIGLTADEMEIMDIGSCLDFIQEYIDQNQSSEQNERKASQSDFDSF